MIKNRTQNNLDISRVILDPTPLLEMFENDTVQVREILNDFIQPATNTINEILEAHSQDSLSQIEMSAHKLKSSARSVGAYRLGDICERLEKAGKNNDREVINCLVPELEPLMEAITTRIHQFEREHP